MHFTWQHPEVENNRSFLNAIAGMPRPMKEGKQVNITPKGYKKPRDEFNKLIIESSKEASLVCLAFEEMTKGENNIMEVWR